MCKCLACNGSRFHRHLHLVHCGFRLGHLGIFIADEPRVIVVNIVQMTYLTQYLDSADSTCMAVLSSAGNVAYKYAYRDNHQRDCLQSVCFLPLYGGDKMKSNDSL
jgi:hypothetical protein